MSDLGALLRKAREERGLSLDEIQELTKIRKRYLEALETGDHSILPGTFYVRAFVKNYSEAVGLEPEEVLRLYQHEVPAAPVLEQSAEAIPVRKPRKVRSSTSDRFGKIGFSLLMWCFLILIVVLVWYYAFSKDSETTKKTDETPITENTQLPEPTSGGSTSTPSASVPPTPTPSTQAPATVTFSSKVGKADKYDIGPPGGVHKIDLKVSGGRNWVEVRAGSASGEKLFYTTAEDGAIQSYELTTEPIYINVGRADLVEVSVDGVIVPDGDRATSKKLLLNPLQAEGGAVSPTPTPTPGTENNGAGESITSE
ncbi:helix-turn-helix domain-containing protein [Paenibacillus sp. GCM10027627]|uniref:helix-turn-helix domain-containing protein n=1 Tax=unclassified Paenibacillus TaxID=185978 RepID=UPI003636B677